MILPVSEATVRIPPSTLHALCAADTTGEHGNYFNWQCCLRIRALNRLRCLRYFLPNLGQAQPAAWWVPLQFASHRVQNAGAAFRDINNSCWTAVLGAATVAGGTHALRLTTACMPTYLLRLLI